MKHLSLALESSKPVRAFGVVLLVSTTVLLAACGGRRHDDEFYVRRAIDFFVSREQPANSVGIVEGIVVPIGPVEPYKSADHFLQRNPHCCRFSLTDPTGYYPSLWARFLSGYIGMVIIDDYVVNVEGESIKGIRRLYPVNRDGDFIAVAGINGD